jgi:DNA repair exonuclease SbcCD ATPase subunit
MIWGTVFGWILIDCVWQYWNRRDIDVILKAIGARNFLGYKKLDLEVQPGLTLIDGANHHFATASSGGSGKSTLQEVIAFATFGKTIRNLDTLDDLIREGSEGLNAWVEYVSDSDEVLRVNRYRDHPRYKNEVRLSISGESGTSRVRDTNAEIIEHLGFDFDIFSRAIVIHSRMTESFDSVGDKYLKQITEKLIGMPDFRPLLDRVKDETHRVSLSIVTAEGKLEQITISIAEWKRHIAKWREQSKKFETEQRIKLDRVKDEIDEAKRILATGQRSLLKHRDWRGSVSRRLKRANVNEAVLRKKHFALSAKENRLIELCAKRSAVKYTVAETIKNYERLGGKVCPTCAQSIPVDHINKMTGKGSELQKRLLVATAELDALRDRKLAATSKRDKIGDELRDAELKILRLSKALHERCTDVSLVERDIKEYGTKLKMLTTQLRPEKNPYEKMVTDTRCKVERSERTLKELKSKINKRNKTLLYYDFWRRGFGPSGIRSFVLDAVNPVLNKIANVYLNILMDGNMSVNINTVRLKKDGTYSDKFAVEVKNASGASKLGGSCDNELHSVNLALNLAMSDLLETRISGGFGFMFIDQAIDLLDTIRGRKAIQLLNHKLNETWCRQNEVPHKRSIWLITHREALKGLVEQKIFVEKRDRVCKVIEA